MRFDAEQARRFAYDTRDLFFQGAEAGKVFSRGLSNRGIEVFPGIKSTDPEFLIFTTKLANVLSEEFPKVVLADGFLGANASSTNFLELNTVAGHYMSPATYTVIGNEPMRADMKLASKFKSTRHEKIFEELIKLRYATHNGERAKLSKLSNSVFTRFSKNIPYKVEHLNYILQSHKVIKELVMRDDLNTMLKKFGMVFGKKDVYRGQADGASFKNGQLISKAREVNDLEYALSGGLRGRRFVADKSVIVDGNLLSGKFGMRKRTANGMSVPVNAPCSAFFEGYRNYADNTYGMTFKHKTRESIEEKVKRFSKVLPLDVTQYDQSVPEWLFDKWLSLLPGNDFFKKYVNILTKCPMFYGGVGSDGDPVWTGNPLDINHFDQWTGLVSGIFYTSAAGKDFFTWAVLCIIDDYYHNVLGNVDNILKWEHPDYAISNMGDDTLLHTNDDLFYNYLRDLEETSSFGLSPYFKVDVEEGLRFVGNVGYKDENNEIRMAGDLGTYFKNMLVPERGLESNFRRYGVYGLLERRGVYQDNPSFSKADEIFMKMFRDTFGIQFMTLMENNLIMPEVKTELVTKQADLEVLMDPSKLYYKYDTSDISEGVLGLIEEKISEANTELAFKMFTE